MTESLGPAFVLMGGDLVRDAKSRSESSARSYFHRWRRHFIGLNTISPDDSPYYGDSVQMQWLERDLSMSQRHCQELGPMTFPSAFTLYTVHTRRC